VKSDLRLQLGLVGYGPVRLGISLVVGLTPPAYKGGVMRFFFCQW